MQKTSQIQNMDSCFVFSDSPFSFLSFLFFLLCFPFLLFSSGCVFLPAEDNLISTTQEMAYPSPTRSTMKYVSCFEFVVRVWWLPCCKCSLGGGSVPWTGTSNVAVNSGPSYCEHRLGNQSILIYSPVT